jgi:hypothetical protein
MARRARERRGVILTAAFVACAPIGLGVGLAIARFLPVSNEARAVVGLYAPLPIYVLLACLVARAGAFVAWGTWLLACVAVAWLAW